MADTGGVTQLLHRKRALLRFAGDAELEVAIDGKLPAGCAFAPRCALATDRCHASPPPLRGIVLAFGGVRAIRDVSNECGMWPMR